MSKVSVPVTNDLCPQTLYVYGTMNEDETPNFGLFCWFSYCWLDDLGVICAIGGSKRTLENIRRNGVFSANLVTEKNLPLADYFGTADGHDADKMDIPVEWEKGAVLDVAVDLRKGSPTYGEHVAVELSEDNHRQFFIPRGFAHGFAVLSETAVFQYKCDNFYAPQADGGISIKDEDLGIDWQIPTENAILSEKDIKPLCLKDFDSPFSIDMNLYPEFE